MSTRNSGRSLDTAAGQRSGVAPKRGLHPWAVGITAVIVVFLVATITVVLIVSQQDYHLVTQNYYEKDRGYQDEIDTRERTRALAEKPRLELDPTAKVCILHFPARPRYDGITGELLFYRISDAAGDSRHAIALDAQGRQYVSVSALRTGQWIAKLRWSEAGVNYALEQRMYLE